jgi:hypothetical protein
MKEKIILKKAMPFMTKIFLYDLQDASGNFVSRITV